MLLLELKLEHPNSLKAAISAPESISLSCKPEQYRYYTINSDAYRDPTPYDHSHMIIYKYPVIPTQNV